MPRYPFLFSSKLIRFISNSNPKFSNLNPKFIFNQSPWMNLTKSPMPRGQFIASFSNFLNPNPSFPDRDFDALYNLLENPNLLPGPDQENALNGIGIEPTSSLLLEIFNRLDSEPEKAFFLFKWVEKRPGYEQSGSIFNLMLNILAKSGKFKWVFMILLDKIKRGDGSELVSAESFGILIKHYACLGMTLSAINIFKFASNLALDVFEVLVDALCKYGHVSVASDCIDREMYSDPNWVPSIDVYNMLLGGWFRVRNVEQVERIWLRMRREKIVPVVVTFGVLIGGYCRMGLVDKAVELLGDMRRHGVGPNREIYDPIVDALAREGRFKEALGMLERFLVLEDGPTLLTYNSLVKGFCKANDLVGAGQVLKMMTSRGVVPTTMTYNNFFRCFAKHGKVEEGVNLYRKMIKSGYDPDHHTFHLLLKMLCEHERLELAIEISEEMKLRGYVLDLATSTRLINLLCRMHKFEEAVAEFEGMIQRGVVRTGLIFQTLHNELKRKELHELARKLSQLVVSVPSLMTSPIAFEGPVDLSHQRRKLILQRAKAMSDVLETCSDLRELGEHGKSDEIDSASDKPVEKG